jgi:hypothetical protein
MSDDHDTLVAVIRKNSGQEVWIKLCEYRGHRLLDARVWANRRGEPLPTRRRIWIRVELLPELIAALGRAASLTRAKGLLSGDDSAPPCHLVT